MANVANQLLKDVQHVKMHGIAPEIVSYDNGKNTKLSAN